MAPAAPPLPGPGGPGPAPPRPWRHCGAGRAPRPRLHIDGAPAAAEHKMEAAGPAQRLDSTGGRQKSGQKESNPPPQSLVKCLEARLTAWGEKHCLVD